MSLLFPTILKLKRTLNPKTLQPFGYREIGQRLGRSAMRVQQIVKENHKANCCPTCLRRLEVEKVEVKP